MPVKIALVTPAAAGSRSGNRVTAIRWERILRKLGHQVSISVDEPDPSADLLIAIHAWRSANAVAKFRLAAPSKPVLVLLAGTDIYKFQYAQPELTLATMRSANLLIGLHDRVANDIPAEFAAKLRIIRQSLEPSDIPRSPSENELEVCVVGHLREEKDPFRAALATEQLPSTSAIRVVHLGGAHSDEWAAMARVHEARNPRYVWHGELAPEQVRACYAHSHAMIISSIMEGGANVVSEAIVDGLAVLASDISGNRGLLGDNHPAYFPPGDTQALARLMQRFELDGEFVSAIRANAAEQAPRFQPRLELQAWQEALAEVCG